MIKTKQLLLFSTLAAMTGAAAAAEAEGTLTITGEVIPQTCVIKAENVDVELPEVLNTALSGEVGSVGGLTPFSITAACQHDGSEKPENGMNLAFDATSATVDADDILINLIAEDDGGATGVGVQLLAEDGTPVQPSQDAGSQGFAQNATLDDESGTYKWSFSGAQYYAIAETVTPGEVEAEIAFTISYD